MKRQLVAAMAAGSLVFAAGAAGAAGYGLVSGGGTEYVLQDDIDYAAALELGGPEAAGGVVAELETAGDEPSCGPDAVWCATETATATATVAIAQQPSAPGGHALRFRTTGTADGARLANTSFAGTPLEAISALAYRTMVESVDGPRAQPPALNIELAFTDRGYVNLVWEPVNVDPTGASAVGVWRSWEPSGSAGWYVSNPDDADAFEQYSTTFVDVKKAFPGAVIRQISLNQGTGNDGLVAFADLLQVNDTTYDFDAEPATTVVVRDADLDCADGGWCVRPDSDSGTVTIEQAVDAPGLSALRLETPSVGSRAAATIDAFAGRQLSSITALSYATSKLTAGSDPGQLPALKLVIATAATPTVTLVYEPLYGHPEDAKTEKVWKTWEASQGAGWWSPANRKAPGGPGADSGEVGTLGFRQYTASLAEVVKALPQAMVLSVGVGQGSGNAGLSAFVDTLRVNETTYDFQTAAPQDGAGEVAAQVQAVAEGLAAQVAEQLPAAESTASASPTAAPTSSPSATSTPEPSVEPSVQPSASSAPTASATPSTAAGTQSGGSSGGGSGGGGGGSVGVTGSSSSPSPSPSPSTSSSPTSSPSASPVATTSGDPVQPRPDACRLATVSLDRGTIVATGAATVTWTATPGSAALLYAYSQPSTTYKVVRRVAVGADGTAQTALRPATNTRLYALQEGCASSFSSASVVLNVRTAMTLAAKRNGVRDYTFSGDSLPARPGGLVISLYRVTGNGSQVLAAQTRADARNGEWSIRRTFSGGGRFGFVVRTGQDLQNAPGNSNVRSLLVF